MKLENVKCGARVVLKEMRSHELLKVGSTGTIMEDLDVTPRVKWDNFNSGTHGLHGIMSANTDIWAVPIDYLELIK